VWALGALSQSARACEPVASRLSRSLSVIETDSLRLDPSAKWRRSVVKSGVKFGSVRSSHQTVSGAWKISFTFHFDTSLSSYMMLNLQSYPTTVWNERMWHLWGQNSNTLWPLLHIFMGSGPNPHDLRPWHSCIADSQIGRRFFRRKSAEKMPASRNRRQKCSAECQPKKNPNTDRCDDDIWYSDYIRLIRHDLIGRCLLK